MTLEEAIKILKECRERKLKYTFYTLDEYQAATDMAIKALEQEPDAIHNEREQAYMKGYEDASKRFRTEPCEDAISRQAAIDAMYHHFCDKSREECAQILHEVPSVNPQANKEDIHREREQAYMRGYEDGSRKYRTVQSEDAISRQVALNAMYSLCGDGTLKENEWRDNPHIDSIIDALKDLPSVSTENTGRWIGIDEEPHEDYECNKCGYIVSTFTANIEPHTEYKYCPNCGAKMVEPQESEDKE